MTGGTSGLGFEASQALAMDKNNHLVLLSRKTSHEEIWKLEFQQRNGAQASNVEFISCDLSSLLSLKRAIREIKSRFEHIDVLLNNAGLWHKRFTETTDGIEETFHVNLLSHYILLAELKPLLQKSEDARVVNTSSGLHQGTIVLTDPEYRNSFSGFKSYRQSKLGMMLLSRALAKKEDWKGISFYSQHPGMVSTNLGQNIGGISNTIFKFMGIHPLKGAQNLIHLSSAPKEELTNGEYYYKTMVKKASTQKSYDLSLANSMLEVLEDYKVKSYDPIQLD